MLFWIKGDKDHMWEKRRGDEDDGDDEEDEMEKEKEKNNYMGVVHYYIQ